MKRLSFLILAALTAVFAILVATDGINFETDRIDRWVMIFGFAGVAFFVGLASADSSGSSTEEPTSERAAAEQALGARPKDPSGLPAKPGSLLRSTSAGSASAIAEDREQFESMLDLVALESDPVESDPVEAELQDMIDEDQMDEITALVDRAEDEPTVEDEQTPDDDRVVDSTAGDRTAADSTAADGTPGADEAVDPAIQPMPRPDAPGVETADDPIARIELRLADYDDEALKQLVKDSEKLVIAEMVRTGQLTSAGELTERDIASMVFLAYTSDEMLAELRLRKSLDQPGDVAVTGRALAPLKNIE